MSRRISHREPRVVSAPPRRRAWRALPWLTALLALAAGCASGPVSPQERMMAWRPLYGVAAPTVEALAAFEQAALGQASERRAEVHNGVPFRRIRLAGRDCVLFPTGVSLVNAAMTTQLALDHYPLTHVIFFGVAGGVNSVRVAGEVVIPETWTYHTEAAYRNPTADGAGWDVPPGVASALPNFGMIFPETVEAVRAGQGRPAPVAAFETDPGLRATALKVATARSNDTLAGTWPKTVTTGVGVSGPAFVDNRDYRVWLSRVWQAEVVDLESAAVAQVCWANRVPFLSIQAVGGLAGGSPEDRTPPENQPAPMQQAARVVFELVRALPD